LKLKKKRTETKVETKIRREKVSMVEKKIVQELRKPLTFPKNRNIIFIYRQLLSRFSSTRLKCMVKDDVTVYESVIIW